MKEKIYYEVNVKPLPETLVLDDNPLNEDNIYKQVNMMIKFLN